MYRQGFEGAELVVRKVDFHWALVHLEVEYLKKNFVELKEFGPKGSGALCVSPWNFRHTTKEWRK